ncbi:MAG TPA: 4Fe-4S dicluster domain-containing protein [Kofleriaceae bacterium]|nr:4Fe-4S dicluster domain-containing protein [Kofleriaceae bacterium]
MTRTVGFFTDTTLCIGCKACEVACKQWNQLPDDGFHLTGMSYDNTAALGASTWRHVTFAERPAASGAPDGAATGLATGPAGSITWKMMSDVCKHCERAGCLEACPTGAIVRTEHGSIYIQPDVCNGCGYCVPACPFGVVARRDDDGRAFKCTLCYDRLQGGLEPACAKACPTDSIQFGPLDVLRVRAADRLAVLTERGHRVRLYGESAEAQPGTGGLHAMFLLADEPEVYNLPPAPTVPTAGAGRSWLAAAAGALGLAVLALGSALLPRS